jgi:putative hemolysin
MKKFLFLSLALVIVLTGCNSGQTADNSQTPAESPAPQLSEEKPVIVLTSVANPASTNCVEKGGVLKIVEKKDGSQYGVCYFEGNRQCEEWALFRGDCPMGGVKIIGYDNEEQTYCAIRGGEVLMSENICKYQGEEYDLDLFMNGEK